MTLRDLLTDAVAELEEARVPSPLLDAEVLLACSLGRDRVFLHTHPDLTADVAAQNRFRSMVDRRLRREPLQYITGHQEFYGHPFDVGPDVLIPRPETELIVRSVLELNSWSSPRILDVGTGSGCIATVLAAEMPGAVIAASDVSMAALPTARKNAERNGVCLRLACVDLLDAWTGPFEFVVSNPPYVHWDDAETLQVEVGAYEPSIALFGNRHDPMITYRELILQAQARLTPGGYLILEIGYTMASAVTQLLGTGWSMVETRRDLQGFPRVIVARKAVEDSSTSSERSSRDPARRRPAGRRR